MASTSKNKFTQAYALISTALERGEGQGHKFFPSVASLASLAQVSTFTAWKVVRALRDEGRLTGEHGHRYRVPVRSEDRESGGTSHPRAPATRRLAVQKRIERDILNGRFRYEFPLPSQKELTILYGVSPVTLRKALGELVEQNVLAHRGARYSPVSMTSSMGVPRPRIVLLGQGTDMGMNITWGYWRQEYFKLLEIECAKARIALEVICFFRNSLGLQCIDGRTEAPAAIPADAGVLGYLYEVTGPESIDNDVLHTLIVSGKPLAILDEDGTWPGMRFLKQHAQVRLFRNTVSNQPARQVARFLLESGHRTVVFVSPFHGSEYSIRRLRGLTEGFAVEPLARVIPVTSRCDGTGYIEQGAKTAGLAKMQAFFSKWRAGLPFAYSHPLDVQYELLKSACGEGRVREELDGLFEAALDAKDATAWALVNDTCASYALDFLASRGIAVPSDLALISFDDLPEALKRGISSYNFNGAAMMMAMLGYIVNPRKFPSTRPIIEIEGRIIERQSTAGVGPRATH